MTVAAVQFAAGTASATFAGAPTAGNILVIGVSCHSTDSTQTIDTPTGWTAVTPVYRCEQPGWSSTLSQYSDRVFMKVSDGSETTISNPGSATTYREIVAVELPSTVELVGQLTGWNPHPGPSEPIMAIGNRSSEGWSALDVGSGHDVAFVAFWSITDGVTAMDPTYDQAGVVSIDQRRTAIGVLSVASTSGGYRVTGTGVGFDNFPSWTLMAFEASPAAPVPPEPGVIIDPVDADPIPLTGVMSWRITRGASPEITGGAQPGKASVVLDNRTNKYNPNNASSTLIDYLRDGTPIWIGVEPTGIVGSGTVTHGLFGGRIADITPMPEPGVPVPPRVELTCEDALAWLARVPVRLSYTEGRSHGALRAAILAAANETSTDLEPEIETMPLSAVDTNALAALEAINQANGSRHFIRPGDSASDWYEYVVYNRMHGLGGTASAVALGTAQHVQTSGWRLSADTVINQQRAAVTPITFTPATFTVWESETMPVQVTPTRSYDVWVDFDDYVSGASVNSVYSGGTPTITLTSFGDSAHLEITSSGTVTFSRLAIDGSLARRSPEQSVVVDDTASQAFPRGVRQGPSISGEYVGTLASARGIADHVVWRYAQPQQRPTITVHNWFPQMFTLDLFDVISFTSPEIGLTARKFEVVGLTLEGNHAAPGAIHHTVTYVLQELPDAAQTDPGWFVADSSTANSTKILGY